MPLTVLLVHQLVYIVYDATMRDSDAHDRNVFEIRCCLFCSFEEGRLSVGHIVYVFGVLRWMVEERVEELQCIDSE